ncbi:MAG: hypothetical protein FWC41_08465, partial [Firmicutes bacterium]|nr:hypothetical protein [Bacillota bacterium]
YSLKSLGKKTNSDGTILKLISGLAGVGLLAIGGKKLMDRNSKKVINQSGNESIQNQDIQNQFSDVKKQNLKKYLPINIPMPKWTATKWDGGVGSCAIDSVLTIGADFIKVVLNKQAEYDKLNNIPKGRHFRTSTELLPCLMLIDELFENSKITGQQPDIHKIKYDQLKSKYDESKKHVDRNGNSKTIGQVLTDILTKNPEGIPISDTMVFIKLFCYLSDELPNILEIMTKQSDKCDECKNCEKCEKDEKCEKPKRVFYYPSMENVNANSVDEFAFEVLSGLNISESTILDGKKFMANGMIVYDACYGCKHYYAFVKAPLESLTEELIEQKKWFVKRCGFENKDCRCLIKNLMTFEDIIGDLKKRRKNKPILESNNYPTIRVMSYRRVI